LAKKKNDDRKWLTIDYSSNSILLIKQLSEMKIIDSDARDIKRIHL